MIRIYVERRSNKYIIKKIGEIKEKGNRRGSGRTKKNWTMEDMRLYGVN